MQAVDLRGNVRARAVIVVDRSVVHVIDWHDSNGGHQWSALDWIAEHVVPDVVVSVGFLLVETAEYVTIVQSLDTQLPPGEAHADNFLSIPKSAIRWRSVLAVPPAP